MKGNFSRLRFGEWNAYTSVLMQQGRALLDADWNAQAIFAAERLEHAMREVIGRAGGPADHLGFEIEGHAGLEFNTSGRNEQQSLRIEDSPSLPFHPMPVVPTSVGGGNGLRSRLQAAPLPADSGDPDALRYSIALSFARPEGSAGCLLCRPGHCELSVDQDGKLALCTSDDWSALSYADEVLPADRPIMILLVATAANRQVFVDGECVIVAPPERYTALGDRPALVVAAAWQPSSGRGRDFLRCRIDDLLIWRDAFEGAALARLLTSSRRGNLASLVCELAFDRLSEGRVHDRSDNHNPGILSPREGPWSFAIIGLRIGPGVYFVDGVAVENPAWTNFRDQPFQSLPCRFDPRWWTEGRVFLETWDRWVTPIQVPALREVALGGPDTTGRVETVWQVNLICAGNDEQLDAQWQRVLEARATPGGIALRQRDDVGSAVANDLYRVEIANAGWAHGAGKGDIKPAVAGRVERAGERWRVLDALTLSALEPEAPAILLKPSGATWEEIPVKVGVVDPDGCVELIGEALPADDPNLRLLPLARFKFSRSNGADAFAVASISKDGTSGVASLILFDQSALTVTSGDWVELSNDAFDLARRSGPMFKVGNVDRNLALVELRGWTPDCPVAVSPTSRALIRRWSAAGLDGAPLFQACADKWMPLDQGIEVNFDNAGWYDRGAYWTAPTRSGGNPTLEWPEVGGEPQTLPPEGPRVGIAPLADLGRSTSGFHITDRRSRFEPISTEQRPISPVLLGLLDMFANEFQGWQSRHGDWPPRDARQLAIDLVLFALREVLGEDMVLLSRAAVPRGLQKAGDTVEADALAGAHWHVAETPRELAGGCRAVVSGAVCRVALEDGGIWRLDPKALANENIEARDWHLETVAPVARSNAAAASVGDLLYLVGGASDGEAENKVDRLRPGGVWERAPDLPVSLQSASAAVLGDIVFVAGGETKPGQPTDALWALNPVGPWISMSPMREARTSAALVAYGGRLYAIGGLGSGSQPLASVEIYDPVSNTWTTGASMPAASFDLSATAMADGVLVAGGRAQGDGQPRDVVAHYKPEIDSWRLLARLARPRAHFGLTAVASGRQIIAIGGLGPDGRSLSGIERLHAMRHLIAIR